MSSNAPATSRRFVSYVRVSTVKQGASGLGLEAQREAIREYLTAHSNAALLSEFVEVESGKRNNRPRLREAIAEANAYGATLIIAKLDRLARNVHFVSSLMESGVEFVAVDFPQANRLTVHILAAVAEHERDAISARTKAALAQAKARGKCLGNPNGAAHLKGRGNAEATRAVRTNADAFAAKVYPIFNRLRAEGFTSANSMAKELNSRGVRTPRGGAWTARSVLNLEGRCPAVTTGR